MVAKRNMVTTKGIAAPPEGGAAMGAHDELAAVDAAGDALPTPQARVLPPNPGGVGGVGVSEEREREHLEPAGQGEKSPAAPGHGSSRMRSLQGSHVHYGHAPTTIKFY